MLDSIARPLKNRLVRPIASHLVDRVHPGAITLASALFGVLAAVAVAEGRFYLGLLGWTVNRILDGLDGAVARAGGRQSDFGGYVDIIADFIVYAAIPIGVAIHFATGATWLAASVMLATFYVNSASWLYLAALLEKRSAGAGQTGEETSITMPDALIGGTETLLLYTLVLALPAFASRIFWLTAFLTSLSILQRMVWALRFL
ncbi:MAG: CDP-alcohol phosphatidyltransferase family protein [Gemmatimonadaceae bacterium]